MGGRWSNGWETNCQSGLFVKTVGGRDAECLINKCKVTATDKLEAYSADVKPVDI